MIQSALTTIIAVLKPNTPEVDDSSSDLSTPTGDTAALNSEPGTLSTVSTSYDFCVTYDY